MIIRYVLYREYIQISMFPRKTHCVAEYVLIGPEILLFNVRHLTLTRASRTLDTLNARQSTYIITITPCDESVNPSILRFRLHLDSHLDELPKTMRLSTMYQ